MFWYLVVFLFVGQTIHVEGIGLPVELGKSADCDLANPGTGEIKSVNIEGCDQDDVCTLVSGRSYTITIQFISGQIAKKFDVDLKAQVAGILTSFRVVGFDTKGCGGDHGVTCPLAPDNAYTYHNQISIKPFFPAMKYNIQILITGDNDSPIACKNMEIKISRETESDEK